MRRSSRASLEKKTIHFPWVLCMTSIKPNWTFDWSTLHYGKIYRYSRKWSYTSSLSWILRHTAAIFYALCRLGYKRLKSFQDLHKRYNSLLQKIKLIIVGRQDFSSFGKEANDCQCFSEIFKKTHLSIVKGSESQQINHEKNGLS